MTDRVLSPVENSIDVGIRIGPLPDSSMVATRIGSIRVVACASPDYLAARETPTSLQDIAEHDCITIDDTGAPRVGKFAQDGVETSAPILSRLTVNTSEAAVQAAGARSRDRPCHVLQYGG